MRGKQIVSAVSPEAGKNVRAGMPLAEAKARCAGVMALAAKAEEDRRGLEALGRWMMRFSPNVSIDPPSAIIMDARGLERLHGGLEELSERVKRRLGGLGIAAGVVIAPTAGAAWAIAGYGRPARGVVKEEDLIERLGELPVESLRLEGWVVLRL